MIFVTGRVGNTWWREQREVYHWAWAGKYGILHWSWGCYFDEVYYFFWVLILVNAPIFIVFSFLHIFPKIKHFAMLDFKLFDSAFNTRTSVHVFLKVIVLDPLSCHLWNPNVCDLFKMAQFETMLFHFQHPDNICFSFSPFVINLTY